MGKVLYLKVNEKKGINDNIDRIKHNLDLINLLMLTLKTEAKKRNNKHD